MKIDGVGNLCLWCMTEMGENTRCPHCGHDAREPMNADQAIPAGTVIGGHYLLGMPLGQGGFGITYLAYDLDLHIKRAIKEYFPRGLVTRVRKTVRVARQSEKEIYRKGVDAFYREAQSIARFLGHPNVVQVHSFFQENDTAYFVMDYVEGVSFQQYLDARGGKIPWEEAYRLLKPIGEALSALHAARLLHRDVKPDNIFITRNGTPKLLDFGAARYVTSLVSTQSSASVVTPGYAPVEQYGSMAMQGTFTDVYALSATFYRAVSGIVPIPAPDRMMREDPLQSLDKVAEKVPARIGAALSRGMAVRSEKRTQSVAQLLQELELPQKAKFPKLPVLIAAAFAAALLGILLGLRGTGQPTITMNDSGTEAVLLETVISEKTTEVVNVLAAATEIPTATPTELPTATATKLPTATATKPPTTTAKELSTATALPPKMILKLERVSYKVKYGSFWYVKPDDQTDQIGWLTAGTTAGAQDGRKVVDGREWTSVSKDRLTGWILSDQIEAIGKYYEPNHSYYYSVSFEQNNGMNADESDEIEVGDAIHFGHYEQDNNLDNGAEEIEWRVLAREDDRLLLLSEYGLAAKPYNLIYEDITWEKCTLRSWLNTGFYESAFNAEEKQRIVETEVKAETNHYYPDVDPGNDTKDKIFLLSLNEVDNKYLETKEDRQCKVTAYADIYVNGGDWWLRSPGIRDDGNYSVCVRDSDGYIFGGGCYVNNNYLVRPALWLNLSTENL